MSPLKQLRLELDWSVEKLAEVLCVSERTIQRWEAETRSCPPGVIEMAKMVLEQKRKAK